MKKILIFCLALSLSAFANFSVKIGPFKTINEAKSYKDKNPNYGITVVEVRYDNGLNTTATPYVVKNGFENEESAQDFINNFNIKQKTAIYPTCAVVK